MKQVMRAIIAREFGPPDVLELREAAVPEPPPGCVRIRVRASSVNPVDTKIRSGMLAAIAPDPMILGGDVAGEIDALGQGCTSPFRAGDPVYACAGGLKGYPGALAEYMTVPESMIARCPLNLTWEQAAALPLVSLTAWEALERAGVREGQKVLVHGGAGGVGQAALQLAVLRGAEVHTTVSTAEKEALVRGLGAHEVIRYREETVEDYVAHHTAGQGYDVVIDTVGGDNVARCFQAARVSGVVASISTRTTADLSPLHAKGLSLHVVFMLIPLLYARGDERRAQGAALARVTGFVEEGRMRPLTDPRVFSFEQAARAHELLESGGAVGKITLTGFP